MAVPMELVGVRVDALSNAPMMVLRETEGERRLLTIMIGSPEAQAIAFALDGVEIERPLTHDLITILLDELDTQLERVVISALRDEIYYADLVLDRDGQTQIVSARPSDAIAVAVRLGTPLEAEESVLALAGFVEPTAEDDPDDDEDDDEVVEEFKEFIEQVNPEDFAS